MTRGTISCTVFAAACVAALWLSIRIEGTGPWGVAFLLAGALVAAAPHVGALRVPSRIVALVFAVLALLAVGLGLLAATVGGSFRLPGEQAALLAAFGVVGLSGLFVFRALRPAGAASRGSVEPPHGR